MAAETSLPRLGIALGGGSARGWAHIGVLRALMEEGIEPEIVCGTSIGALVGGVYAAGRLEELGRWVGTLTRRDVLGLVDFTTARGGVIGGRRLMELYREHLGDIAIEELPRRYAAVATDLQSGTEVWLQEGPLLTAIRASISIPGLFTPIARDGRWLVDGGLVNPVPVNLCRALGAELVIAVDLLSGAALNPARGRSEPAVVRTSTSRWNLFARGGGQEGEEEAAEATSPPTVNAVIASSLDIMQTRLSRSRLAGDPPDLLLTPRVRQVAPLEFAGGQPTIDEGYGVMRRMLPALRDIMGLAAES